MTEDTNPNAVRRPLLSGGLRPRPKPDGGQGRTDSGQGQREAVPASPATAHTPARHRPEGAGDAGAVLRRHPPEGQHGSPGHGTWPVRPMRRPSSIVDSADGTAPSADRDGPARPIVGNADWQAPHANWRGSASPIVDTQDDRLPLRNLGRPARAPVGAEDGRMPSRHDRGPVRPIVDNGDGTTPYQDHRGPARPIVDNGDHGTDPYGDDEEFAPMPTARQSAEADPVPVRLKGPGESRQSGPSGPDGSRVRRLREAHKEKVVARARSRGVDPGAGSVESAPGVTRSEKTHNQYLDRGRMLVRRYRRELDLGSSGMDAVNPIEFVNWLFSLKPTLSRATWRPYRQAAKAILATMPHDDTEQAISMIESDIAEATASDAREEKDESPKSRATRAQGLPRRTSSLKEKRFPKADFDKAISFLRYFSRSRFAPVLIDWMIAGIATGLRPIEWQATDIEIREDPIAPRGRWVWLYVLNAKATNGRGNGIVRTLDLTHFEDRTLEAVRRMSERGSQWLEDGVYDSMQSQCSQLLYSVCDRIFSGRKKTYALYSLRHQFVANAKSYHRPESVSALVGHVVTDTAIENYGKKVSAWGPDEIVDRPEPVAEEVSTVKQRLMFYEERVRLRQEAGLPAKLGGDD